MRSDRRVTGLFRKRYRAVKTVQQMTQCAVYRTGIPRQGAMITDKTTPSWITETWRHDLGDDEHGA